MQQLQQSDLTAGRIVLIKGKKGYFPQFFVNWQFDSKFGVGPVCNHMLSYETYGNFSVYESVFNYENTLNLFQEEDLNIGNIILVYEGGYAHNPKYPTIYTDRNWIPAYYCGVMNGMIMASSHYNPKTNNFTSIKAYPAMGKYIQ